MKAIRNSVFVLVATGLFFYVATTFAKPVAPAKADTWSKPVAQLSGRMRVAQSRITTDQHFQITLELANRGSTSLAVQCGNPHIFSIAMLTQAGKPVKPISARIDILSSPQWGVIPGRAYLGFPVSIQSQDGAKGSHLDITTLIWKLPPGKYQISGSFTAGKPGDFMGKPGKAKVWEGKIELPPIDIEIVEKE